MFDALFVSLIGAVFFSRLTFVLLNFEDFGLNILRFILINGFPGLSLVGALIGGFFTLALFTRVARLPFMEVIAYAVPSLFLALGIGKIGAFFGGNTIGTETTFPLAIQYVGHEGFRHIVAIYEAIVLFVGFFFAQKLLLTYRRDKVDVGSIFSFFIVLTSLMYLALDFLKDDILYLFNVRFNVVLPGIFFVVFGIWELTKYRAEILQSMQKVTHIKGKKDGTLNTGAAGSSQKETAHGSNESPENN